MYKFFIFAWVPIAVLSGVVLAKSLGSQVAGSGFGVGFAFSDDFG